MNADTPETLQDSFAGTHRAHLVFELQSSQQFTATDVRNNKIAKLQGAEPVYIRSLKQKLSKPRMGTTTEVGTLGFVCLSLINFPAKWLEEAFHST